MSKPTNLPVLATKLSTDFATKSSTQMPSDEQTAEERAWGKKSCIVQAAENSVFGIILFAFLGMQSLSLAAIALIGVVRAIIVGAIGLRSFGSSSPDSHAWFAQLSTTTGTLAAALSLIQVFILDLQCKLHQVSYRGCVDIDVTPCAIHSTCTSTMLSEVSSTCAAMPQDICSKQSLATVLLVACAILAFLSGIPPALSALRLRDQLGPAPTVTTKVTPQRSDANVEVLIDQRLAGVLHMLEQQEATIATLKTALAHKQRDPSRFTNIESKDNDKQQLSEQSREFVKQRKNTRNNTAASMTKLKSSYTTEPDRRREKHDSDQPSDKDQPQTERNEGGWKVPSMAVDRRGHARRRRSNDSQKRHKRRKDNDNVNDIDNNKKDRGSRRRHSRTGRGSNNNRIDDQSIKDDRDVDKLIGINGNEMNGDNGDEMNEDNGDENNDIDKTDFFGDVVGSARREKIDLTDL